MPMYEYRCASCGRDYEQLRRMSEADKDMKCPFCESEDVELQVSACSIGGCGGGASRGFT